MLLLSLQPAYRRMLHIFRYSNLSRSVFCNPDLDAPQATIVRLVLMETSASLFYFILEYVKYTQERGCTYPPPGRCGLLRRLCHFRARLYDDARRCNQATTAGVTILCCVYHDLNFAHIQITEICLLVSV